MCSTRAAADFDFGPPPSTPDSDSPRTWPPRDGTCGRRKAVGSGGRGWERSRRHRHAPGEFRPPPPPPPPTAFPLRSLPAVRQSAGLQLRLGSSKRTKDISAPNGTRTVDKACTVRRFGGGRLFCHRRYTPLPLALATVFSPRNAIIGRRVCPRSALSRPRPPLGHPSATPPKPFVQVSAPFRAGCLTRVSRASPPRDVRDASAATALISDYHRPLRTCLERSRRAIGLAQRHRRVGMDMHQ